MIIVIYVIAMINTNTKLTGAYSLIGIRFTKTKVWQ